VGRAVIVIVEVGLAVGLAEVKSWRDKDESCERVDGRIVEVVLSSIVTYDWPDLVRHALRIITDITIRWSDLFAVLVVSG
jgi:hypothetical protein